MAESRRTCDGADRRYRLSPLGSLWNLQGTRDGSGDRFDIQLGQAKFN